MANHTTIEHTKKSLKLQQLLARLSFISGLLMLWLSGGFQGSTTEAAVFGWVSLFGGIVWSLAVSMAKWWHHA